MNCNDFYTPIITPIKNLWDIAMLGDVAAPKVMRWQGAILQQPQASLLVRNKYGAVSTCNYCANQWYIDNNADQIELLHGCNSNPNTIPLPKPNYADLLIQVIPSNISLDYPNDCPSNPINDIDGDGIIPGERIGHINAALSEAVIQTNSIVAYYNNVIDGGNTQNLLNAINSNIGEGDLKNLLLQYSPYLSDAVLIAYFNRTNWPLGHGVQIHNANKPVSQSVWNAILQRNLPSGIMSTLSEHQSTNLVNARTGLESQLSLAKFNLQNIVSLKLNYFLTDTLPSSKDSVIQILLRNIGEMNDANTQLVFAYINKGDLTKASQAVDMLPTTLSTMTTLFRKLIALQTAPKGSFSLLDNAGDLNFVTNLASSTTAGYREQGTAQALLKFVQGRDYYIPHLVPNISSTGGRSSSNSTEEDPKVILANDDIIIYPNPAQNGVTIFYSNQLEALVKVEITDILGKVIYSNYMNNLSKLYIPLQEFNNGIYLVTITKEKEVIYKTKLIKQN
ncbi:MAG: T9SS type A sorting domain-containing protein [Bacteroidetes bacterium]|nr:T9SS type A sorting domain-containing protein [Bacteroidota bacterium]